jgi:hypothetical protein
MLLHSLGLVYKSMRGVMTNFGLGRNRTHDPRVPEPKRTPVGYILYFCVILCEFGVAISKSYGCFCCLFKIIMSGLLCLI